MFLSFGKSPKPPRTSSFLNIIIKKNIQRNDRVNEPNQTKDFDPLIWRGKSIVMFLDPTNPKAPTKLKPHFLLLLLLF